MVAFNAYTVREEARLEELVNCVEERGVEMWRGGEERMDGGWKEWE